MAYQPEFVLWLKLLLSTVLQVENYHIISICRGPEARKQPRWTLLAHYHHRRNSRYLVDRPIKVKDQGYFWSAKIDKIRWLAVYLVLALSGGDLHERLYAD